MEKQKFAQILSISLIPPVVAAVVITALVLTWEHGSVFHRITVWLAAVLTSGGLQIAYVLYLRRMEQVTAWDVPERGSRSQPYLISAVISAAGLLALLYLNASVSIWGLLWCFTINTLVLYAINLRWKISAHLMGLTGPLVFLWPLLGEWTLALLPLAALLGWARVTAGSHDLPQVAAGAVAGVGLTLLQTWVLLEFVIPVFR